MILLGRQHVGVRGQRCPESRSLSNYLAHRELHGVHCPRVSVQCSRATWCVPLEAAGGAFCTPCPPTSELALLVKTNFSSAASGVSPASGVPPTSRSRFKGLKEPDGRNWRQRGQQPLLRWAEVSAQSTLKRGISHLAERRNDCDPSLHSCCIIFLSRLQIQFATPHISGASQQQSFRYFCYSQGAVSSLKHGRIAVSLEFETMRLQT